MSVLTRPRHYLGTPESVEAREKANVGCYYLCPRCGENRDVLYCVDRGITNEGIVDTIVETICKDTGKRIRVDHYRCMTCGAEWQSRPYEWELLTEV